MQPESSVVWESKKSFLQGAWDGGSVTAVPVHVAVSSDGLTITRWYPALWILFGFGLIAIYRALTAPRQVVIRAAEVSRLRIVKGWVDNPLSRRRFEANRPMFFKVTVTVTNGSERRLRLMLTKALVDQFQQVDWIGKVIEV
jgi:hypothetical protein